MSWHLKPFETATDLYIRLQMSRGYLSLVMVDRGYMHFTLTKEHWQHTNVMKGR